MLQQGHAVTYKEYCTVHVVFFIGDSGYELDVLYIMVDLVKCYSFLLFLFTFKTVPFIKK
jgi:hypothetical protein